jgi:hypothetical protein
MPKKNKISTGELISSVVFFCFGVWLISEGSSVVNAGQSMQGAAIFVGGVLSMLAAFRFQIANLIGNIFGP